MLPIAHLTPARLLIRTMALLCIPIRTLCRVTTMAWFGSLTGRLRLPTLTGCLINSGDMSTLLACKTFSYSTAWQMESHQVSERHITVPVTSMLRLQEYRDKHAATLADSIHADHRRLTTIHSGKPGQDRSPLILADLAG